MTQSIICQACNKKPAKIQTSQIIDGRQYFVNLCEECFEKLQKEASETSTLDKYSRDLTKMAEEDRLDPVIGREDEIERLIHVLSRRTKNNPVLIGDPGVGKTAIVEGLAQRIINHTVPETLDGKRVIALDLASLLAGASFRGEFEKRLKKVIEEVTSAKGQIILFIDELHLVVGAGAAEGAIDAANMLKPALARGELQTVGATTLDEYRKHIEKDAALERRFQPILVAEPTIEDTKEVLRGLKDRYEEHHKVIISDGAIEAAAELSDRYISDRFLPDKAIDLMDEASVKVRLKKIEQPENLKQVDKEIQKLKGKKDQKSKDKIKELKKVKEELTELWMKTKEQEYPTVTREDIASVVSKMTGIPLEELSEEEKDKLTNLEERLHQRIINQDEAVKKVAAAIRRARAGLKDVQRPIGSFIFFGPTGVGKTELTKALAEVLYGNQELIVRLDMSEFMEKHEVSRLVGAPPGYVGYEEGGQLTEVVRRNPFSVVLLDEIEKAHAEVFNLLLQILEDGRLTDGHGRTVDFRNVILVMTSNLQTMEEIKSRFRPEFINRLDEIIKFSKLGPQEMEKIFDLLIGKTRRLLKSQKIKLVISEKVKKRLSKEGYDEEYGARPMRRLIQRVIENPISDKIIKAEYQRGDVIKIDIKNKEIVFQRKE